MSVSFPSLNKCGLVGVAFLLQSVICVTELIILFLLDNSLTIYKIIANKLSFANPPSHTNFVNSVFLFTKFKHCVKFSLFNTNQASFASLYSSGNFPKFALL